MVIEGRNLVDLGHRDRHLGSQGNQMALVQPPIFIIEPMQMLDQQIALMRPVADQGPQLGPGLIVGLSALEFAAPTDVLAHIRHRAKRHAGDRGRGHRQLASLIAGRLFQVN